MELYFIIKKMNLYNKNKNIKMNFLMIVVEDEIKLLRIKEGKITPLKNDNPINKSNHSMMTRYKYININNQTYKNILNSEVNINNHKLIARQSKINNLLYVDHQTYINFITK